MHLEVNTYMIQSQLTTHAMPQYIWADFVDMGCLAPTDSTLNQVQYVNTMIAYDC